MSMTNKRLSADTQKTPFEGRFCEVEAVLFAERISSKRHSLIYYTEEIFSLYGVRSRAPTDTSPFKYSHTSTNEKRRPKASFRWWTWACEIRTEGTKYY